ncbi:AAA family ATPase [Streptomyces sp. NPDC053541]|uniref:AAA family ATPase n=1 Tax=Streptomyces sp. NPDC053541 TaxID=3365709 RepID=UPI0037CD87BD
MTIKFRLNAVVLHTTEGEVRHEFSSDLTVLEGPTGAGKTTLLELIKYGFAAGEARLASVATESVNDVALDVSISDEHFLFLRSLDAAKSKNVRIVDLRTGERLPDHTIGDGELSFNGFLLGKLGLPDDIKAAAQKSRSSKAGSRVTFGDVFKYLYVPQYAVNRDIADSRDGYYDPKRKAVFELLFKLTDPEILAMQSNVNILNGKIDSEGANLEAVLTFLNDSNTSSREEVEQALGESVSEQENAQEELNSLREELDPVVDRQTQVYRDLLTDAERTLAEARSAVQDLLRERGEISLEKRRVKADSARLERMRDAGARLANIEFAACPRCMQSLNNRDAGHDVCRLCLQPDPVASNQPTGSYELQQLELQMDEMEAQLEVTEEHLQRAYRAVDDRESLVKNLTETLESRTANRITPRLQAFSDASDRLATARTRQEAYELALQQWDRVADIEREVQGHRTEQERLKAEIAARKTALAEHKDSVLSRIEEEFRKTVAGLKIATVESCGFDRENYLPLINGKVFTKTLMSGGGSMTATQIAYWTSLITVAREVDCRYPSILVIDGPRLALNTATETCAAIYKRLVELANGAPGTVQLIISDNELPDDYQGEFARIRVDYHHPTVTTVPHPGEGLVDPIASVDE